MIYTIIISFAIGVLTARALRLLKALPRHTPRVDQAHLVELPNGDWFCPVHDWTSVTYDDGCPFCGGESVTSGGKP